MADFRERPILFSGPMVAAILAGEKTQTRRIVATDTRPMPDDTFMRGFPENPANVRMCGQYAKCDAPAGAGHVSYRVRCPYGDHGDRLWVRETFARVPSTAYRHDPSTPHRVSPDGHEWAVYREGWDRSRPGRWRPSIHMPRWASRVTLEVASVHVERLHEISLADINAEGTPYTLDPAVRPYGTRREQWQRLWESIHGPKSWEANPWVWVIAFRRLEDGNA